MHVRVPPDEYSVKYSLVWGEFCKGDLQCKGDSLYNTHSTYYSQTPLDELDSGPR